MPRRGEQAGPLEDPLEQQLEGHRHIGHERSAKRRVLLQRGSSSLQISASLVVPTLGDHRNDYTLRDVFQSFIMSINRRRIKVRGRMVSVNFKQEQVCVLFPSYNS